MSSPAAVPGFCRVTVLTPRATVDVALPAGVPVAELVPMVLELVGEPVFGLRPEPWRLSGVTGGVLPPAASLDDLGVLDGDLLRIAPHGPAPAPPVFDDPVDALASTAGAGLAGDPRFRARAVLALAAAAAVVLAVRPTADTLPPAGSALIAGSAAALALGHAVRMARRARATEAAHLDPGHPAGGSPGGERSDAPVSGSGSSAVTAALVAVLLAAAAGWTAITGPPGPEHLLLASIAAGTVAAAAQIALRVVAPVLVGVVAGSMLAGVSTLAVLRFGVAPGAAAAGVGAVALVAGPLLPRAALRLSGLPRPLVPADTGELVDADHGPDLLPAGELAERTDLARGHLAGLSGGCAAVAALAAVPATATGGWAGPAFAAVTVAVLGLRARSVADPGAARTVAASALAAGIGLAAVLVEQGGAVAGIGAATALLLAAAALAATIDRPGRVISSPVARRAVDLAEGLLLAATVPLALGVMDLYGLVRGL